MKALADATKMHVYCGIASVLQPVFKSSSCEEVYIILCFFNDKNQLSYYTRWCLPWEHLTISSPMVRCVMSSGKSTAQYEKEGNRYVVCVLVYSFKP